MTYSALFCERCGSKFKDGLMREVHQENCPILPKADKLERDDFPTYREIMEKAARKNPRYKFYLSNPPGDPYGISGIAVWLHRYRQDKPVTPRERQ